jgi:methylphosphotriester-DNA--protein-cysteine methyltransferase
MRPSTFRQHFRTITGMSPVQFQKLLHLQEALCEIARSSRTFATIT